MDDSQNLVQLNTSYLTDIASNPLVRQPAMTRGLATGSPITFPEEQEDPRVSVDTNTGGGIWGFFKVIHLTFEIL